jgi:hypothetical protein
LSDSRLALVRRAAALLAPKPAGKFLQLIAHELADMNPLTDGAARLARQQSVDLRRPIRSSVLI